jgi:hypothetical protein
MLDKLLGGRNEPLLWSTLVVNRQFQDLARIVSQVVARGLGPRPLLAKHDQDVHHCSWPGMERLQGSTEYSSVQRCWCRLWVSSWHALLILQPQPDSSRSRKHWQRRSFVHVRALAAAVSFAKDPSCDGRDCQGTDDQ